MEALQILNACGLVLQLLGSLVAASGVFMTFQTATELASTYWDLNVRLRDALLVQSRRAVAGLVILAVGSVLQFAALFQ